MAYVKVEMGSAAPPTPPDRRSVRRMLTLFAVVAIVGVVTLAFSVPLGLFLLIIAEIFFAVAYRRFSKSSKAASQPSPS
jgi:heme A synthase